MEVAARMCPGMPSPGPIITSDQVKAVARRSKLEAEVKEATTNDPRRTA